jgi:Trk K+ transport system NAD-binding subunit
MIGNEKGGPVIVCGLGHLGYRVVLLLRQLGLRGAVIAGEARDDWRDGIAPEFAFHAGDAREEKLLRGVGLAEARAILILTGDDLANVSIALAARRINPRAAVVVRLFDQALGAHLEASAGIARALSSTALAAPAFVAAALGERMRGSFEIGDAVGLIEEIVAGPEGLPLDTAVIALQRAGQTTCAPPPDAVRAGDRLTCLRFAAAPRRPRAAPVSRSFPAALRDWWSNAPRGIRMALASFLGIVVFSVALLHVAMRLSLVDALYFVVTTITTVGYGDYSFRDAPPALKLYGVFLMLCGAGILATLFSIVADAILGARFRELLARGCSRFRGHTIVAGVGGLGYRLVKELARAGETVVAVEQRSDGEFVQAAREVVPVVLGDGRDPAALRRAGSAGARVFIAATDDDLVNLSAGLAVKRTRPDLRVVLRIFDAHLAERMLGGLGVDAVVSVIAAAAPTFVGCALCPDVLQGVALEQGLVLIFHRRVPASPQAPREGEAALFVRRPGTPRFEPVRAGYAPRPGDELVGARWCPLVGGPGAA